MAYTRREYMGGVPSVRISQFDMGNLQKEDEFPVKLTLRVKARVQIRHTAIEAGRIAANRVLTKIGATDYHFKVRVYPHVVLRENKLATGAGADRVSSGMRRAFGKTVGTAARVEGNQADKDKVVVYLYATNKEDQYTYIEAAKSKGYSVLMLDGQLDVPVISLLEQKFSQSRFVRVDSDIIDRLIVKDDAPKSTLTDDERDILSQVFRSQMPAMEKKEFGVEVSNLGENAQPVVLTENEYMRRMKDISKYQQGMSFYGQMPDTYTVVLNADHKLVKKVLDEERAATEGELKPVSSELKGQQARLAALHQSQSKKKAEEITKEEKDDLQNTEKAVSGLSRTPIDVVSTVSSSLLRAWLNSSIITVLAFSPSLVRALAVRHCANAVRSLRLLLTVCSLIA